MNMPVLELDWLSASESWNDIAGASGSSRNRGKDLPSSSPCRNESDDRRLLHILVIEDNKADVFLVEEAIAVQEIHAELQVIADGEEAMRQVEENSSTMDWLPDLFILDLNLPRRSGHEILACIRQKPRYAHIPVLIMTSSDSENDRQKAALFGSNGYFRKPSGFSEFLLIGAVIKRLMIGES